MSDQYLLYRLLNIANYGDDMKTDTMIAIGLINERAAIGDLSMEKLAARYYVSQPAVSRFIKKLGYRSFTAFKADLALSQYVMRQRNPSAEGADPGEALMTMADDMAKAAACIRDLDPARVEVMLDRFSDYGSIIFLGSQLAMSIIYLLQLRLTAMGKSAYAFSSHSMQKKMIGEAKEDDLVIFISLQERWYGGLGEKRARACRGHTVLWTVKDHHEDEEAFDDVIHIGQIEEQNMGYHVLMGYVMTLYRTLHG
ncbi:MAG: MurR/RpiR family transcriptional regulator [Solobacterium sp.]|nr:MurR/RpiR family transcriptional regulator [Solobacterium sp.]